MERGALTLDARRLGRGRIYRDFGHIGLLPKQQHRPSKPVQSEKRMGPGKEAIQVQSLHNLQVQVLKYSMKSGPRPPACSPEWGPRISPFGSAANCSELKPDPTSSPLVERLVNTTPLVRISRGLRPPRVFIGATGYEKGIAGDAG